MPSFLETSALVDATLKNAKRRAQVVAAAEGLGQKVTSTFVRCEFKRGALNNLVALHSIMISSDDMAQVIARIQAISFTPMRNRLSTMLEQLQLAFADSEVTLKLKSPQPTLQEISQTMVKVFAAFLSSKIARAWNAFSEFVSTEIDSIECAGKIQAPKDEDGIWKNSLDGLKSAETCNPRPFLLREQESFSKICVLRNAQGTTEQLNKVLQRAREAVRRPQSFRTLQDVLSLGDAFLAVEAPLNHTVVSSNGREFAPLCGTLNKPLKLYTPETGRKS
jgi:hypothetical protein